MFYTYIIYSNSKDKYYSGYTENLELRLERHNSGGSRSTKSGSPWKIVCYEVYKTKSEAIRRENEENYSVRTYRSLRYELCYLQ
ncbi:MAG: GIY-YIG nuclease family protein [Armatimonadetes bacterium]|nr:GIY-YIG nuclease family protein [Armatimonadota bacterium]